MALLPTIGEGLYDYEVYRELVISHLVIVHPQQWTLTDCNRSGIIQSRRVHSDACVSNWVDLDEELGTEASLEKLIIYLSAIYQRAPILHRIHSEFYQEYVLHPMWTDCFDVQYRFKPVARA